MSNMVYSIHKVKERERRTATATFRYLKKKRLDKLPKVCYNSKCKEEIPKESRLTARGQGKKLLTNYLKYAILESRKERIQKVR